METKQEEDKHNHASSLSSLRQQWNNPRIVRVSRAFGGKDRHSKVCTVRGLRDRRIRLSVVTAIQLYDLQERLGLSQPSKVIDWLLEAAKDDVDMLPPLQFPPGFYPNLTDPGLTFPGFFQNFDLGSCSSRTHDDTTQRENLDLEKGKWVRLDQSSNLDHGFDIDHFTNSSQGNKLCFPTSSSVYNNNSNNSCHYNLGHLQQSLLQDQSGNVTVAFPNDNNNNNNNNNNPLGTETMSSLFPRYPSFLGGGQLQLFGSNSDMSKQTDHIE